MTTTEKNIALLNAIVPRAPRTPSDMAALDAVDPMSATLATMRGGEERVNRARAQYIQNLIDDARGIDAGTRNIAALIKSTLSK